MYRKHLLFIIVDQFVIIVIFFFFSSPLLLPAATIGFLFTAPLTSFCELLLPQRSKSEILKDFLGRQKAGKAMLPELGVNLYLDVNQFIPRSDV